MKDTLFKFFALMCLFLTLSVLLFLFSSILFEAWPKIINSIFLNFSFQNIMHEGIYRSFLVSIRLMSLSMMIAIPLGTGAGIYMEEYLLKSRWTNLIEANINNLASLPPIIYGILGLTVFVHFFNQGSALITGTMTLSLMVLPAVIVNTRQSLRAVPYNLKKASIALGATRWQTISRISIPNSLPLLISGNLMVMARILGIAAPLIVLGGLTSNTLNLKSQSANFIALPVQIYDWLIYPKAGCEKNAAAGILVLIIATLILNLLAINIRRGFMSNQNKV